LLDRPVGEGAVGQVWRARHLFLNVPVAVKILSDRWRDDEAMKASLLREAESAARIDSDHVVRVVDCGISSDFGLYVVMELVDGFDLAGLLSRRGPLSVSDAILVAGQLCLALEAIHRAGLVHRDVKPENVMVGRRHGRLCVKLADFGVAKNHHETPDDGVEPAPRKPAQRLYGTPTYMSPEQLWGLTAAARDDLWSIAVVVYQCLVGRPPFDDSTYEMLCLSTARGVFVPPTAVRSEVPEPLDRWFRTAFACDPGDRFVTALGMRQALAAVSAPSSGGAPSSASASEAGVTQ
jgi:serine/threonine-protein kinase